MSRFKNTFQLYGHPVLYSWSKLFQLTEIWNKFHTVVHELYMDQTYLMMTTDSGQNQFQLSL